MVAAIAPGERDLSSRRLVQLSNGVFRCVEMSCGGHGAPKVSMRTRSGPATVVWPLEYEASFPDISATETYKVKGLLETPPMLALLHPKNPDLVYFSVEECLFSVDMRKWEV